ncbi:alkene reductase [Halioxenophilus aromaticivorans]|uniref:Alkene reductase n=1 Tax=Halioxenophilus aromaticivorans TaxID=1306992 RepID=A0AAV3TZH6_9ALTE
MSKLQSPLKLGANELKNRILMAPLTRSRADADHVPTDIMVEYYAQRASAGLIIAEATMAMPECSAFWREPGIHSQEQIAGWQKVTQAVHEKGGKIFLQVWHGGRACHPALNDGKTPVAPSAIAITGDDVHTPEGKQDYTTPRALADDEIPEIIAGFVKAAENAKEAGFDGIEIHGANGYLLDEFLRTSANQRTGPYGGPLENRAKLLLEIIDAVIPVWGAGNIGVRLSPLNSFNGMKDEDPQALVAYVSEQLNQRQLAYLHLMRGDFKGEQSGDVITPARKHFTGTLILNMGYDQQEAEEAIEAGTADAVAFGVPFIANPDLPRRFAEGAQLNEADPNTFYSQGPEGYIDYPFMD